MKGSKHCHHLLLCYWISFTDVAKTDVKHSLSSSQTQDFNFSAKRLTLSVPQTYVMSDAAVTELQRVPMGMSWLFELSSVTSVA